MVEVSSTNNMKNPSPSATVASEALSCFQDARARKATDLANEATPGYQRNFETFVTNGPSGTQVRGVQMSNFDASARGALIHTNRPLDLSVEGKGFLLVDTSGSTDQTTDTEVGLKITGHFQLDHNGFVYDEADNYLLGMRVGTDGTVGPVNTPQQLERIQIPLKPSEARASTEIKMNGTLPVDRKPGLQPKEMSTHVYDSLGVEHEINFKWNPLDSSLLWRLNAEDAQGATLETLDGRSWTDPDQGLIVKFSSTGVYQGVFSPAEAAYTDWQDAREASFGGHDLLEEAQRLAAAEPDETTTGAGRVNVALAAYILATYPGGHIAARKTGADAVKAAFNGGVGTDLDTALEAARTAWEGLQTAEGVALTTLNESFDGTETPQIRVADWRNSEGGLDGAAESVIRLPLNDMHAVGDDFYVRAPTQDGMGSSMFQQLEITKEGLLSLSFAHQGVKPIWAIPLINYTNNNGLRQDGRNVLRESAACGSYVLAQATYSNLGALKSKTITSSNVDPQKAMLDFIKMGHSAQNQAFVTGESFKLADRIQQRIMGG